MVQWSFLRGRSTPEHAKFSGWDLSANLPPTWNLVTPSISDSFTAKTSLYIQYADTIELDHVQNKQILNPGEQILSVASPHI